MQNKPLKELCFPNRWGVYGIPAKAEEYDYKKTRYLRITDIAESGELLNTDKKSVSDENISKYLLEEGDIVFARTGNSTGKTYYHESKNGELAFAGFLIKFSLNPEKVNPKYLRYYTISRQYKEWVENYSLGSTRGNLNANSFANCPIPLPNRAQQDLLVKVLSDLDAKIEVNNKINQQLEAMAKTLYDYWFVQFDFPFDGVHTERGRSAQGKPSNVSSSVVAERSRSAVENDSATTKPPRPEPVEGYKSSGGTMVYNKELKREIPEGWESGTFGDYIKAKGGYAFKSAWWTDDGLSVIKIKDIDESYSIDISNCSYVGNDKLERCKDFQAKAGDVLLAMTGATVGKFGIVPKSDTPILVNQRVAHYRLGDNQIEKLPYLINSLSQDYFRETIFIVASGAAQPNISSDQLDAIPLVKPPKEIIQTFNKKLVGSYEKILNNKAENQKLVELRDWLLPMLMNGQVQVNSNLNLNLNLNDAGDVSSSEVAEHSRSTVENGLGRVAEGGGIYKKGK